MEEYQEAMILESNPHNQSINQTPLVNIFAFKVQIWRLQSEVNHHCTV